MPKGMNMGDAVVSDPLLQLAERCERATGPDAALDREIWLKAVADKEQRFLVEVGRDAHGDKEANFRTDWMADGARYTASLDAAMTLVPEGWQVSEIGENWRAGGWHCTLAERPSEAQRRAFEAGKQYIVESEYGEAATPALALCAAALRARAQTQESA